MEEIKIEESTEISIGEIMAVIKPKLLYIILVSVIFGLASFVFTKTLIKPEYKSSATVIVNNRKDESSSAISNDELNSARNLASVYGIIIKSDAVMQPVVEQFNNDITANDLKTKVNVSAVNNTQVIEISVRDRNPELSSEYVNEIIKIAPEVITNMVEVGSVKIVSYPTVPTKPISPNVKNNVIIMAGLGMVGATAVFVGMYLLDKTFKSAEDVEKVLEVPVIGVIPNVDSVKRG